MDSTSTATSEAQRFLTQEQAFHLGVLPTEQAHPLTEDLSNRMARNPEDGLRALFAVFAETLSGTSTDELLDPEVQAALEALGYVR